MTDSNEVLSLSWSWMRSTSKLLFSVQLNRVIHSDILERYQNLSTGRAHETNSTMFYKWSIQHRFRSNEIQIFFYPLQLGCYDESEGPMKCLLQSLKSFPFLRTQNFSVSRHLDQLSLNFNFQNAINRPALLLHYLLGPPMKMDLSMFANTFLLLKS